MLLEQLEISRKATKQGWIGGDVESVVSAMSQLLVMVRLSLLSSAFDEHLRGFIDQGGYIKDLLTASSNALAEIDGQQSNLIDPDDRCWSALPTDSFIEILREFSNPQNPPREIAQFVLAAAKRIKLGLPTTPHEISYLMAALLEETPELALPTDASALAGIDFVEPSQDLVIRMSNQSTAAILSRLYFAIGNNVDLKIESTKFRGQFRSGMQIFLIPQFGGKVGREVDLVLPEELRGPGKLTSDEASLASILGQNTGMVVALMPAGVLFRGGRSRQFRKWLIEEAGLTTVIALPGGLLEVTGLATAILLIDPRHAGVASPDHVLLLSADSEEYLSELHKGRYLLSGWEKLRDKAKRALLLSPEDFIHKDKLAENDYLLQPARYSAREDSGLEDVLKNMPISTLGAVVDIHSPLPVKSSDSPKGAEYVEVRISDFETDGTVASGSKKVIVGPAQVNRLDKQVLRPGDVLLGTKGSIGKCAAVAENAPRNLVASQTMVILRPKKDSAGQLMIDPIVLLRFLSLPEVKRFLESISGGAQITFLRKKDLLNLSVPLPTMQQQAKLIETHNDVLDALKESQKQMAKAIELSDNAFSILGSAG